MNEKGRCYLTWAQVLPGAIFALILVVASLSRAATVWTGPLITYDQPAPDPTQATNQDRITPNVWLTRAASKGLFNAFSETNATSLSPADTEWAFGTLDNYASLHYTNWLAWLNGQSPTTLVGQQAVVHLISEDIYISIQFTLWVPMGSGGFAYQRSTPALANLSGTTVNGGDFSFNYPAAAGFTYVVQSSSDLVAWTSVATNTISITNTVASSLALFSESVDPSGIKFYRVERLPNP